VSVVDDKATSEGIFPCPGGEFRSDSSTPDAGTLPSAPEEEQMDFPALKVRDLEGTHHVIPHDLPGGPHIVVLAFQQWHQSIVDRWKPHLEALSERHPGTQVWEVPSISRGYRLFRSGIDGGMAAAIPDVNARRHTLTAYTDMGALARDLELHSFETVHVYLVDCSGRILWRNEGEPTAELLASLEAAMPAG
jgi:hypothetical protein